MEALLRPILALLVRMHLAPLSDMTHRLTAAAVAFHLHRVAVFGRVRRMLCSALESWNLYEEGCMHVAVSALLEEGR
jgi:hypothetical protein